MQEQEKKNTKGIEHILHTDVVDVLSMSFFGFVISGVVRPRHTRDDIAFDGCKASTGAVITAGSVILGTVPEMFVGFLIYENPGALLGSIAGASMYSAIGTIIGGTASILRIMSIQDIELLRSIADGTAITKTYDAAVMGAVMGVVVDQFLNMKKFTDQISTIESINMQPIANYTDNYLDFNYTE